MSVLLLTTSAADAAAPRAGRRPAPRLGGDALTAMPAASIAKPLRGQRDVTWSPRATAAWQRLGATGAWRAAWDRATGVPSRIWGSGIAAPGANASPDIAAAFARAALVEHLALLAPGASPADFTLVSNHDDGDIRSIGFVQRHGGRLVVGGQISFRFKRDRLFLIGSEALPDIALPVVPLVRISRSALRERATASLRRELALPDAPVSAPGDEVVLPLVGDDAVLGYRIAVPVTIDGGADGRYLAYSDPATGAVLAVRQLNLFSLGTLLYSSVDRYPDASRPRLDQPAPLAHVRLAGAPAITTAAGELDWGDEAVQTVATSVIGDQVAVVNKNGGALATTELPLPAGGRVVWDASATVEDDAQVQTYLAANTAVEFARGLDPGLSILGGPITANVNLAQDCNAFFDGTSINFFHASKDCQNTGLLHDVVFHEYGHAVHTAEIIEGVGSFDGAMSECASDFYAAQITGDPKMGRGFFYTDKPLRDLDPEGAENRWPDDIGEIHKTGIIFGGTFWDLRKALIAKLGDAAGIAHTKKLFVAALRRSVSIPTSLLEVLAADDDDGDLSNTTPNECLIRNTFAAHGLRTASGVVQAPANLMQPTRATTVHVELSGLASCTSDEIDHAELVWKPSTDTAAPGTVVALQADASSYYAQLPLAINGKMLYQVRIVFRDASVMTLPDNRADPFYELYEGRTVPLYCTSFEDGDPFAAGWTTGTTDGTVSRWSWGVAAGGATDPHAAFSGTHVLAQVLDGDYEAKSASYVRLPPIDVGPWSDVHLQYRRWLTVEDSHYDQARITVGGQPAWTNFTENTGDSSATHHIDREWRFQDVALSGYQAGHMLDIAFDLSSDEGLQFGGWTIDDVCVVANVNGRCGDGSITNGETCDNGAANADRPNACRTWCQSPSCGDGIIDDGEACDGGVAGNTTCTTTCELIESPGLGGCCSADRDARGSFALGAAVLGLVLRRRRRR